MSDAPRQPQPPPKKDVALALLQESSMYIHLDPRRPDVVVPKYFMGQPQLILQVGLNMVIPIPDLKIDDEGITCTLSFNRAPFWCRIPWSAVYALVGEDGRGGVWATDVPPEIQQQKPAQQKGAPARKGRPKLTAVGGSSKPAGSEEAKPARRAEAKPAAVLGDAQDDGIIDSDRSPPKLAGAETPPNPSPRLGGAETPPNPPELASEQAPERAAERAAGPQGLRAVPRAVEAEAAAEPAAEAGAEGGEEEKAATPSSPPARKGKREIPPWLRVIK